MQSLSGCPRLALPGPAWPLGVSLMSRGSLGLIPGTVSKPPMPAWSELFQGWGWGVVVVPARGPGQELAQKSHRRDPISAAPWPVVLSGGYFCFS